MHLPSAESTKCANCGFNGPSASECPQCGIVYAKVRDSTDSSTPGPTRDDPRAASGSASEPTRFTLLPWLVGLIAIAVVATGFNAIRREGPNSGEPQPAAIDQISTETAPAEEVSPTAEPARPVTAATDPTSVFDAAMDPIDDLDPLQEPAARPQQAAIPSYTWYEGASGFLTGLEEAQQERKALAVYFYTDWCPYCRELESELLTRARVEEFLKYLVKVRINPENGPRERAIANEYGVRGYPSFFIQSAARASPRKIRRTSGKRLKSPEEFVVTLEKAAR